jgi:hypothetical protein
VHPRPEACIIIITGDSVMQFSLNTLIRQYHEYLGTVGMPVVVCSKSGGVKSGFVCHKL